MNNSKNDVFKKWLAALVTLGVLVLVSACGGGPPKGSGLVGLYMRDNPNDHIRDWESTYLVNGSVDAAKAGFISDSRVSAQMGCFDWIHSYGNEAQESKMSLCIYKAGPVSKTSDQIFYNWGDRARIDGILANMDFK